MKFILLSFEILGVLLACFNQALGYHRPIAYGDKVDISEVPYFASLEIRTPTTVTRCGGSILNIRTVITAAHCCYNVTSIRIRMGSNFYNTGGPVRNATKIIIHPEYKNKLDYDFCLLRMRSVRLTSVVKTVDLPEIDEDVVDGDLLRVAGFGINENGTVPRHLRGAIVPKVDNELCKSLYSRVFTNRMFCAGYTDEGPRTAKGDSGGGVVSVIGTKLHGIISFSKGERKGPRVNGKVSSVRKWIDDNLTD